MKRIVVVAAALLAASIITATALAAVPSVSTGGTKSVTASSATLNGSVNPNGEATTYHFDYGTTTAYGSRTPDTALAAGKKGVAVSAGVTGLSPGTTYHYRLVAANASGTKLGGDKKFTTPSGLSLSGPRRTVFGRLVVLSGTLTGPAPGGVQVKLQENPYPFSGFKNTQTTTTNSAGVYAFNVKPSVNTTYRAVASSRPAATSSALVMGVAPSVSLRLRRSGGSLRARGTVAPAHNGGTLRIQRRTSRGWRTVRRAVLAATKDPGRSSYAVSVRLRKGLYRAYFAADADHVAGRSSSRRVR